MEDGSRRILIVAGPNGAGKTTTLAGRNYARAIPRWQGDGYSVTLFYLSLPTVDLAISRVAERVRQGGHHVPDDVVRRRYFAGRENLETLYKPIVDDDNSGPQPLVLDRGRKR
jgi:predicted ABC-type ATPase